MSGIIRANAIRLILRAANIAPSSNPSGFSDVDGKLAVNYAGYIAKARELQCIRSADTFRPFDYVSEGEYAKMAVCVLASPEGLSSTSLSSAPSQAPTSLTQYPTTPISPTQMIYGSFPTGGNSSYALASDLASLANQVSTLSSSGHAPVTLGSANGLTLSGQQLSLGIASSTTIGSLSSADWNLFNSKINLTSLSATGLLSYNSATGLFSWTGTTTNIAEGTNLYFTDSRAQNALSGIISTVNGNIATATGNIAALSGNITTLSGAINALNTSVSTLSGSLQSVSGTVSAI